MDSHNKTLSNQFAAIEASTGHNEPSKQIGQLEKHRKLNRYKNIVPYDHSRVILKVANEKENTYINASYLNSYDCPKLFIATQGPLDNTIEHFWLMIWQENCRVIVMLAQLFEKGRKKCAQYWPNSGSVLETTDFTIKANQEFVKGSYVVRKLEMKSKKEKDVEPVIVTQYQFMEWHDHGVPITTSGIIQLHSDVLWAYKEETSGPIVTHCSAGAGRTGAFIAIDHLLREMETKSSIDVHAAVMEIRKDRCNMVQTLVQYNFIHKVVAEIYLLGWTDCDVNNCVATLKNYSARSAEEFDMLKLISPIKASCKFGSREEYMNQNRSDKNIPFNHSRVVLTADGNDDVTPYINASFVANYTSDGKMIAAQGPMPNTTDNFWKMIIEYSVKIIVMLTPLEENGQEMCSCYWPSGPLGSDILIGKMTIKLIKETKLENYTIRTFDLTFRAVTARVTQVHYENWSNFGKPPRYRDILHLVKKVKTLSSDTSKGNILIHCSDGLKQTGVFCALFNLIERWNNEQRLDVFRAVKDLRDMRPNIVPSLELYRLCYATMKDHLATFDPYDNFR